MFNIIVNPIKKRAKKAIKTIAKYFKKNDLPFQVFYSETKGQTIEIAKKLSQTETEFILIGGDGTLHEFINGVEDLSKINLGIIPAGTGNDFCKAINLPKKPLKALDIIMQGNVEKVDYIECNDKKAINTASCGLDVDVIKKFNSSKRKGKFTYLKSAVSVVGKIDGYNFSYKTDEKSESDKRVLLLAVCNGEYFGSGMHVSPLSNLQDGLLNVVQIDYLPPRKRLFLLSSFLKGKHIYKDFTKQLWTEKIEISKEDDQPITINLDGELYEYDKVELCCNKMGLNLYMNKIKDI